MLYIDSADRARLTPLLATGLFAGITTNPTILQRAGLEFDDLPVLVEWAREHDAKTFFAQATGTTVDDLRRSADIITALGEDVVIKLVATTEGLTVARELTTAGRRVLITAVYHPAQILLAQAAGAEFIAPYVGRATENARDGIDLVRQMAALSDGTARILAASLRSVDTLVDVAAAGAADATLSTAIADALLRDELTLAAAAEFEAITDRAHA